LSLLMLMTVILLARILAITRSLIKKELLALD